MERGKSGNGMYLRVWGAVWESSTRGVVANERVQRERGGREEESVGRDKQLSRGRLSCSARQKHREGGRGVRSGRRADEGMMVVLVEVTTACAVLCCIIMDRGKGGDVDAGRLPAERYGRETHLRVG